MAEDKVLIIDNDEATCQLMRTVLMTRGFQVNVAQLGKVGLDIQNEKRCGLIFLDADIRDLEVSYLVNEFRRLDDACVLVLMGYQDHSGLVQEALNFGAVDYLYKPVKAEEIYFKARHLIDVHKLAVNTNRALQGVEERNISLQKQNLLLAKRIEESTKNLSKLYEDLRETYMRTIKALAHAIDARDHYTFSHSDNVTHYAEIIAREMKIDQKYTQDLCDACQLHDLGKIGIPDNVLTKPSQLTPAEYEEIKLHTDKGAQILEPLRFLVNVTDIVKHHHERWDGTGYPDRLKGEAIPLGSRIMTVADSYDAMVSARPYRKVGMLKIEAIAEIKKHSGTQFDPKVVEAFLKVVDQF